MFTNLLLTLILSSLWLGLFLIVKQQGRILLRLDKLEPGAPQDDAPSPPSGLAVGEEFPSFQMEDLDGRSVSLEDYRGKHVLLVNWSPGCGYCELIAPDLARLPISQESFQLLLLAHEDAGSNRTLAAEHGLKCPILLVPADNIPAPFRHMGTPVAYLLDTDGRVAEPMALGSDDVPRLAKRFNPSNSRSNQALKESRLVRDGIKAGTPAPSFRLPDINGRVVSLDDYRERRLLLVFSDPHCGPCDELAPQLASLHRAHARNGLDFVMVGRGDPDENRLKADQSGIQFPVVLQEKWKLSKEYGIFSTPVAFLIGENGVTQNDVAIGVEAITTLANEALKTKGSKLK